MRLTNYSIENYKSIRTPVSIAPLETINCFIGPNNEGKSTVVEALRLLGHLTEPIEGDPESYFIDRLPSKSRSQQFKLRLEFEFNANDVTPNLENDPTAHGTISYTVCWSGQVQGAGNQHLNITDAEVVVFGTSSSLKVVAPVEGENNFMAARAGLQGVLAEGVGDTERMVPSGLTQRLTSATADMNVPLGIPRFLAFWASRLIYVPSQRKIDHTARFDVPPRIDQHSLPIYLHEMRNNKPGSYAEFENLISNLIPSIRRVYTHVHGQMVSIHVSPESDVEDTGQAFRLDTVGEGVQEILYLASVIWLSDPGSIIVIEEPERGLHASSQRLLLNAALAHAREFDKQIFWTTHSTLMAPLRGHCSVFLVTLPMGQSSVVTHVEGQATDILTSLGQRRVDFYDYDLLIVFDGETEEAVLPIIFEYMMESSEIGGIQFRSLGGDIATRKELMRWFLRNLSPSSTKVFLFADNDEGAQEALTDLQREFNEVGTFTGDHAHLWDCGVESRGAEFEDNFSLSELVQAANDLAGDTDLNFAELESRAEREPTKKISKVLGRYYYEIYSDSLSKPRMGQHLGELALERIRNDKPRGKTGTVYEFEEAIKKAGALLAPMATVSRLVD